MDSPSELAGFIESVGVPVATAIGLGGALWWLIKYVLGSIVEKITEAQSQTEADIKDLKGIVAPDERRIGRNPDDKVK